MLAGPELQGQMLQVWQAVEFPFYSKGKLTSNIQTQFRTENRMRDFTQGRVGPQIRYALHPKVTLLGGYYFTEVDGDNGEPWANAHRLFTGAETPIQVGQGRLSFRGMLERYFGGDGTPEYRYRGQASYRRSMGPFTPMGSTETFFNAHGYMAQRVQGGVRLPAMGRFLLDVTYLYDFRSEQFGGRRQVIYSTLRIRGREK